MIRTELKTLKTKVHSIKDWCRDLWRIGQQNFIFN